MRLLKIIIMGGAVGSLFMSSYIFLDILLEGSHLAVESNLYILIPEFILSVFCLFGLLYLIFKGGFFKNENSNIC